MISEITVKITLGPQTVAKAEGSGGSALVEVIPHPPDAFESSVNAAYDVPPVPDAAEESAENFPEIPVPDFEEGAPSSSNEIAPPE